MAGKVAPVQASYFAESLADGRLRIGDQPDVLFGALFAIPALVGMAFFAYRAYRAHSGYPLIGALFCSIFLFAGMRVMSTCDLVLDRSADLAKFHNTTFLGHDDFTLPLSSIDHAEVQSGSHDSHIQVVLKNGDAITFGDSDQKPGKGRAAHALNEYIGSSKR